MCGRYTLRKGLDQISEKIVGYALAPKSETKAAALAARFNIAPGQRNLVLRKEPERPSTLGTASMSWGLVPSWSKGPGHHSPLINARSETISEKPSFKAALKRRRCIVPADGFYEWKRARSGNQPYFFNLRDDSVFMMAGVWETWSGEHGQDLQSYTVLTTRANSLMVKCHPRMPVILQGSKLETWLEEDVSKLDPATLAELFAPIESGLMSSRSANPAVGNSKTEGPACLEAPASGPSSQLDLGL